jgi:ABC-type dipeptide/oligopeptide/nickel transport system permease component
VSVNQTKVHVFVRASARHLFQGVSLLAGVLCLSFILFQVAPGDPARVQLGPTASEERVQALRKELGLDRPLWQQFVVHIRKVASLDLGRSIFDGRSVSQEVKEKFAVTATIGLQAAILALLGSYGLNVVAFSSRRFALFLPIINVGVLMPVFFTTIFGALLIGWLFPSISLSSGGNGAGPFTQLLPSVIASFYPLAVMTTVLHEKIEETKRANYYRAAKASGSCGMALFHRTALRPVLVSWLAVWVNQLSLVFFASLVLEVILSISGTGNLLLNAVQRRDFPVLEGILLINACFFIFVTWASESTYALLDPRA